MFNRETALVDPDADNKAVDADEALQELGADDVAFGYLTTTIVVADRRCRSRPNEKLLAVERIINGRGFVTIRETLNAVEAWLGSPARQPLRQRAPADRAHPEPRPHDAGVGGVGRARDATAHLDAPPLMMARDARQHAVPARPARRRCRPHPDRRPDRRRQVGAARRCSPCSSAASSAPRSSSSTAAARRAPPRSPWAARASSSASKARCRCSRSRASTSRARSPSRCNG